MPYNIDSWITKKLSCLTIPLSALYECSRRDWLPDKPVIESIDAGLKVSVHLCEDGDIEGELLGKSIVVSKIKIRGECSGLMLEEVVGPALRKSAGELEAVLVWEGGDSITRLTALNGDVRQEEIEL